MIKLIRPLPIPEQIYQTVLKDPDRIAFQKGDTSLTYGALWEESGHAARLLQEQGTSPVVLFGHKDAWQVIAMLACLKARRAYVPVEKTVPPERLSSIIEMSGAGLLITEFPDPTDRIPCCTLGTLSSVPAEDAVKPAGIPGSPTAYMMFTSGSTGNPKGVPISQANLHNFVRWVRNLEPLKHTKRLRVLNQACFSFDVSVADIYFSFCGGHTMIPLTEKEIGDLGAVIRLFKEEAISLASVTPTFIKFCLLDPAFNAENLPALKYIYFCGEPLENATVNRLFAVFPNLKMINAYGPTEATSAVSAGFITPEMGAQEQSVPIGKKGEFATEITVEDGEIVLKGESVFGGYLGGIVGGWYRENGKNCYRTGDLGYFIGDYLYCAGRRDRQIKFKGYRIELDEIEQRMLKIPGVDNCAVVAKYADNGSVKTIQAFAVSKALSAPQIKDELKGWLPSYMIPKTVKMMDALPRNKNGKIDRKALGML